MPLMEQWPGPALSADLCNRNDKNYHPAAIVPIAEPHKLMAVANPRRDTHLEKSAVATSDLCVCVFFLMFELWVFGGLCFVDSWWFASGEVMLN